MKWAEIFQHVWLKEELFICFINNKAVTMIIKIITFPHISCQENSFSNDDDIRYLSKLWNFISNVDSYYCACPVLSSPTGDFLCLENFIIRKQSWNLGQKSRMAINISDRAIDTITNFKASNLFMLDPFATMTCLMS